MVKEIPLQNGMVALVDDEDFERVNQHIWSVGKIGQIVSKIDGKQVSLKKFIIGDFDSKGITNINKNFFDCRKENLRFANQRTITRNTRGSKGSSSKYKGVYWDKSRDKWAAEIRVDNKKRFLGRFDNEDEAAKKYNEAAFEFYGEDCFLNVIGKNNNVEDWALKENSFARRNGKSGYRGVRVNDRTFTSSVYYNGVDIYVGSFADSIQAAKAYDQKAFELYGDKAILNFPEMKNEYIQALPRGECIESN
ncbi:AP2 domain-containing protein [Lysinibacillus fusiformis]|uniref:AP2 domain-containing protein n=1 Tax=Lysinibacillus fusiformis TaxID=28031 RepID=UPI0038049A05